MKITLCLLLAVGLGLASAGKFYARELVVECPLQRCRTLADSLDGVSTTDECVAIADVLSECINEVGQDEDWSKLCNCPEKDLYESLFYESHIKPHILAACEDPACKQVEDCWNDIHSEEMELKTVEEKKEKLTQCFKIFANSPCSEHELKLFYPEFFAVPLAKGCDLESAVEGCVDEEGDSGECNKDGVAEFGKCVFEYIKDDAECEDLTKKGEKKFISQVIRHAGKTGGCKELKAADEKFKNACAPSKKETRSLEVAYKALGRRQSKDIKDKLTSQQKKPLPKPGIIEVLEKLSKNAP